MRREGAPVATSTHSIPRRTLPREHGTFPHETPEHSGRDDPDHRLLRGRRDRVSGWVGMSPFPGAARDGDVELIVLEGGTGRTLAFGPGHLSISALPGQPEQPLP